MNPIFFIDIKVMNDIFIPPILDIILVYALPYRRNFNACVEDIRLGGPSMVYDEDKGWCYNTDEGFDRFMEIMVFFREHRLKMMEKYPEFGLIETKYMNYFL